MMNRGEGRGRERFVPVSRDRTLGLVAGELDGMVPLGNLSLENHEQAQPVIFDGVYVTTAKGAVAIDVGTGRQMVAGDAAGGGLLRRLQQGRRCPSRNIYRTPPDAYVVALDAKTGKEIGKIERRVAGESFHDRSHKGPLPGRFADAKQGHIADAPIAQVEVGLKRADDPPRAAAAPKHRPVCGQVWLP